MEGFARNLREFRRAKKWSQKELAVISAIPLKTLQNYEQNRGGGSPTLYNLMLLADLFDVSPYHLYYGRNSEMKTNSIYMDALVSELTQLSYDAIRKIHDSVPLGTSLPKLSITEEVIRKISEEWNKGVAYPKRGYYRPFIEQTIRRYAENRRIWKEEFDLH